MSSTQWNYNEFLTFLLIYASYADMDFSQEEKDAIRSKVSSETFDKMFQIFNGMGDYECLQEIMNYKGLYFPTEDRKREILDEMKELFSSDGDFSSLEKNLLMFLKKLL